MKIHYYQKIPYHQTKIKETFEKYCNEFTQCVQEHVEEHLYERHNFSFFKLTYPLFVLLESLSSSDYFYNPSKELILQEALREGKEDIAAKAARNLNLRDLDEQEEFLKTSISKQHFTPYFQELYSDLLVLLNNYYMNNYRGCYISLRNVLEDLYRHLYYKDHPQEFFAITNNHDEYELGISPKFFRDYLKRTSYLKPLTEVNSQFERKKKQDMDLFGLNEKLYKDTSAHLHASNIGSLSQFVSNTSFRFKEKEAEEVKKMTEEIVRLSITFLICAHRSYFVRFNDYTKCLIFKIYDKYDKKAKHNFRKLVNV